MMASLGFFLTLFTTKKIQPPVGKCLIEDAKPCSVCIICSICNKPVAYDPLSKIKWSDVLHLSELMGFSQYQNTSMKPGHVFTPAISSDTSNFSRAPLDFCLCRSWLFQEAHLLKLIQIFNS